MDLIFQLIGRPRPPDAPPVMDYVVFEAALSRQRARLVQLRAQAARYYAEAVAERRMRSAQGRERAIQCYGRAQLCEQHATLAMKAVLMLELQFDQVQAAEVTQDTIRAMAMANAVLKERIAATPLRAIEVAQNELARLIEGVNERGEALAAELDTGGGPVDMAEMDAYFRNVDRREDEEEEEEEAVTVATVTPTLAVRSAAARMEEGAEDDDDYSIIALS
jgi:hypothetical protein